LKPYLRALHKAKIDPLTIDKRFAFVDEQWKDDFEMATVEGARFEFVMIHRQ
jgi:hypothetical protein